MRRRGRRAFQGHRARQELDGSLAQPRPCVPGLKQYDTALAAYVAAKKIDRHSVAPHLAHAKVQLDLGRIDQATTELNFVVEMEPKNLEALILLGQVSQMPA